MPACLELVEDTHKIVTRNRIREPGPLAKRDGWVVVVVLKLGGQLTIRLLRDSFKVVKVRVHYQAESDEAADDIAVVATMIRERVGRAHYGDVDPTVARREFGHWRPNVTLCECMGYDNGGRPKLESVRLLEVRTQRTADEDLAIAGAERSVLEPPQLRLGTRGSERSQRVTTLEDNHRTASHQLANQSRQAFMVVVHQVHDARVPGVEYRPQTLADLVETCVFDSAEGCRS